MVIDHVGIVVKSLEDAIRQWRELFGYRQASAIVLNTRQKTRVVFLTKKHSMTVKLIQASDAESPVAGAARRGGGLHHLCFRCDDLDAGIKHLQQHGVKVLFFPEPGEAFGNHDIAFLWAANNLNLELVDTAWQDGALQGGADHAA